MGKSEKNSTQLDEKPYSNSTIVRMKRNAICLSIKSSLANRCVN